MATFVGKQTTMGAGVFTDEVEGITVDKVIRTGGDGYWSSAIRNVKITGLVLVNGEDSEFGELRVFFDNGTWDTMKHGLIYTDKRFMKGLREFLDSMGLVGEDVHYSEQGMQGDNYVSYDVGSEFIKSFLKIKA